MFRGVAVSTLVHASVLAMAAMSWPHPQSECDRAIDKLRRENPGIRAIEIVIALPQCATSAELPIDFEDVGLVSNVSDMRKAETEQRKAEPLPPEEEAPAPVPESTQTAEPEEEVILPDPKPVKQPEQKKPEPKKEPVKAKEPDPLIQKKPEPKKKDDLDFLNDFDKVLQDKRNQTPRSTSQDANDRPVLGGDERDRKGAGERTASTASMEAYIKRELGAYWTDYGDLPPEDQIEVTIRIQLNEDGSIDGAPVLVQPSRRPVGRKGLVVDRALGAARKFFAERRLKLPEDEYDKWQEIEVVFGRDMMDN